MRKWPSAPFLDRQCVKDFVLNDVDNIKIHIVEGHSVWFSVYGSHHDEKYFPEPDKFHTKRFSDVNRENNIPGTYT